jgi:methylated-DNA-[protein]-cysteine S-methyltransferase
MTTEAKKFLIFDTTEGPAAVVGGSGGIAGVILPGLRRSALGREIARRFPGAREGERGLKGAAAALASYFETGRLPARLPRLDLSGIGGIRKKVYEALARLPAGRTVTYAELAQRIGHPGAHRSVGSALARNPVPVFVPCHRVIRSDGGMGGFTAEGGIELKRRMLELEGAL